MKDEPEPLDPREIKVLADILALVLQDQPGQSAVALDAIRRRARQNRMTGGALKNLFQIVAAQAFAAAGPPEPPGLPDDPEAVRSSFERLRAANRNLEKALAAANGDAARLRADFDQVQARLIGVQQQSRELAAAAKSGRTQAGLFGAAIATCVVIVAGVTAEQAFKPSPPEAATYRPPPLFLPSPAPSTAPSPPVPVPPGGPGITGKTALSIENDPELQETLQRLSRGAQSEQPDAPDHAAAPPAAAVPTPPSAAAVPLTAEVHSAVIAHVKACWAAYMHRLGDVHYQARLRVITDEAGVVREVKLAREDLPRLADPSYQAFTQAAIRSVLDPQCAQLPIPAAMQGHKIAFDFVFVP